MNRRSLLFSVWPCRSVVLAALLIGWSWQGHAADNPPRDEDRQPDGQPAQWLDYFQPGREESLIDEARQAVLDFRFAVAEQLLDQALQVNRASAGLHNPSQLDVMDDILQAQLLQRKWQGFDQRLDYLSWLNSRLYADDPERLAEGLLRQSRWHRAAAAASSDSSSAWYLIQGKYLDWQAISALENRFGKSDPRLVPILYRIVLSHYYQTVSIERRGMTSFEFKTQQKVIANGWMSSRSETVRRSYRIGKELLERIRAIHAVQGDASMITDGLLQLHLADWELLYGAVAEAAALYRQAYRQLVEAGIVESALDDYFAQPRVLPLETLQLTWESATDQGPGALRFEAWSRVYPGVQVPAEFLKLPYSLQRTDSGRARARLTVNREPDDPLALDALNSGFDVQLLDVEPVSPQLQERARAEIPLLSLRPRLKGGELVAHEPILLDYRFAPE